jgi:hypothetical protein
MSLLRLDPPTAPPWVSDALGDAAREGETFEKESVVVRVRGGEDLLLVRAVLPEAAALDDRGFRAGVTRCYVAGLEAIHGRDLHTVRAWNFVPDIRRPSEDGFSRYELFNAGRQDGYRECYGEDPTPTRVTASAVGHPGRDLVVHLLAGRRAPEPVENPRQRPSYEYSARYGPEPPCFSRASWLEGPLGALSGRRIGLVAGTASIVGEDSVHPGDLEEQLAETCRNLATVAGQLAPAPLAVAKRPADVGDGEGNAALSAYRELRVYVPRGEDETRIRVAVARAFPRLSRFDLVSAKLCRPELLVEAEGILCWTA